MRLPASGDNFAEMPAAAIWSAVDFRAELQKQASKEMIANFDRSNNSNFGKKDLRAAHFSQISHSDRSGLTRIACQASRSHTDSYALPVASFNEFLKWEQNGSIQDMDDISV